MRGSPRITAVRGNSGRSCVMRKKRKVVMAIVPARKRESRAQCPYVVVQLQKSAGSILAPNKLVRSARKRVAVRVNGGLARHGHRRENVGGGVERNDVWRVGSPLAKGRDRLRPRTA